MVFGEYYLLCNQLSNISSVIKCWYRSIILPFGIMMKKVFSLLLGAMVVGVSVAPMGAVTHATYTKDNSFLNNEADAEVKDVYVPGAKDNDKTKKDTLINVIKGAINWTLGILALIALIVLLWGGFQMVTANGDDGAYKA